MANYGHPGLLPLLSCVALFYLFFRHCCLFKQTLIKPAHTSVELKRPSVHSSLSLQCLTGGAAEACLTNLKAKAGEPTAPYFKTGALHDEQHLRSSISNPWSKLKCGIRLPCMGSGRVAIRCFIFNHLDSGQILKFS